jgi:predicted transglutaminase-like cysteine proteinase
MQPDTALIEQLRLRHGAAAAQRVHTWGELMRQLPAADEAEKLTRVNRFFNRIPQGNDQSLWGVPDYWASPLELLVRNGGDCEDFAIAKYFTLVAVGVAERKLRITYARAWIPREKRVESHMVLAYYPNVDGDPLILDNLVDEIVPAPLRADLMPTHSFNAAGLWSARQRGQSGRLGDTASVKRWSELLDRMHKERP